MDLQVWVSEKHPQLKILSRPQNAVCRGSKTVRIAEINFGGRVGACFLLGMLFEIACSKAKKIAPQTYLDEPD